MTLWAIIEREYEWDSDGFWEMHRADIVSLHRTETGRDAKMSDLQRNNQSLDNDVLRAWSSKELEVVE